MSEAIDEELLGGEDLDDDYDITDEREAALLQDDDYSGRKKEEDYCDERDVLDLDLETELLDFDEDFEEEKLDYEEEEREEEEEKKETNPEEEENAVTQIPNISKAPTPTLPVKTFNAVKRAGPPVRPNQVPQNAWNANRGGRNEKWKRGNGRNFQTRQRNVPQRRRNGTVLINPRYEGTVHLNDNNARLAWDSPQRPQPTPYVQPWSTRDTLGTCDPNLLVSNIMTGIVNTLAHTPPNLLLPMPQNQNFYQPPPTNYEPRMSFEPPPKIAESRPMKPSYQGSGWDYNKFNQAPRNQMLPSSSFGRNNQQFNQQIPKMPGPSASYTNYTNYGANNDNLPPKRLPNMQYDNKITPYKYNSGQNYNNFSQQNNFQNRNANYVRNNEYQNKSVGVNYDMKEQNFNYPPPGYNPNQNSLGQENQNFNQSLNKFQNNTQQGFRKDFNKPVNVTNQISNNPSNFGIQIEDYQTNKNVKQQGNRRGFTALTSTKPDLPEKKPRRNEPETVKPQEKVEIAEQDEDEETRLYRLKIEEQKRERERILKAKEERRKQMLAQKQQKEENSLRIPTVSTPKFTKPNNFNEKFVKTNKWGSEQSQPPPKVLSPPEFSHASDDLNLTFKVSNVQSIKNPQKSESTSGFMTNRVVVVKNAKSGMLANSEVAKPPETNEGFSNFFNNRKVVKKDSGLLNTRLVVVNNLSTSVTQDKLMALSHGIGEIEKLRVDKQERQATILFKSVATAHAFFKKYQRRILDDLSVIEVKLEPML